MMDKMRTDYVSWILLIGIILLLLEVSFFNAGLIFSLVISIGCIYFGRKRLPRKSGKILFFIGFISFIINILSMMTFKFFLLAILVHVVIQFIRTKKSPLFIQPLMKEQEEKHGRELLQRKPLFKNQFMGHQQTPEHVYEWSDINIQTGIGDAVIDLSYTVLPKGEAVIFIRNLIGNIEIFVPYEIELSIHHSVWVGTAKILNAYEGKAVNEVIQLQTSNYETAVQKVKIVTSMMVGDLEVKRI